jgi:NTP pyrophosphatase (non-canonical NTP hydrolase)
MIDPTWICSNCGMVNDFANDTCSVCDLPMSCIQHVSPCPTFDEYQLSAAQTRASYPDDYRLIVSALGLAGEAGEFCDLVKKVYGQGHTLDKDKLQNELGDILWYLADACSALGITLSETAIKNIEKLKKRYPNGFDEKISKARYE